MKQTVGIISTPLGGDWAEEMESLNSEAEIRSFQADAGHHGQRLDRVLAMVVQEFSRSYLQQMVETGLAQVNGQVVHKVAQKLKAGDAVQIELKPTAQSLAFKPQALDLDVVYEDASILVLNKPAGLVVHPAPGNWSGTLLNGLLARDPCFSLVPRAGIVHRLDKDTSGLMVVARTREAMDALVRAMAERAISRQYLAVAQGTWKLPSPKKVDAPIGRDPRNRLRMAVVNLDSHAGKPAQTDFVCLANSVQCCLLRCILHTGRTHQIRVHAASLGHALLGDKVYAGLLDAGIDRQALHAFQLAFVHPVSGIELAFECAPPSDFQTLLATAELRYN